MEEQLYKLKILETCLSNRKAVFSFFFVLFLSFNLFGQSQFTGTSARWDDSAREWIIYSFLGNDDFESEQELRLKWPLKNDWNAWVADYNDSYYNIHLKWNNNPGHWELRSESGEIVSIKTKWRNDFTEWIISSDDIELRWISEFQNDMSSWYFVDKKLGIFNMFTTYRGDPRDWEIEDSAPNVPDAMKIAALFITVYLTNPQE